MHLFVRVFLPFSLGYLISYLARVINAVAGEPISADFALTPGELGLLTSLYFFAFACAQLPFGVLIDKFGPRKVQATLLVFAAAGSFLFAHASSFLQLGSARLIIGLGTATCLTAAFTAYRLWFPADRIPMINGLHMAAGSVGAFFGGTPTDVLVQALGWRGVFDVIGVAMLVSAVATFALVPRRDMHGTPPPLGQLLGEMRAILSHKAFWRICPLSAMVQGVTLSVGSLWAGPWLRDAAGASASGAAAWLSMMAIALMIGFIGFGWLVQQAARGGRSVERVVILGSLAFFAVQLLMIVLPPERTAPLWLLYGITGTVGVSCFAVLSSAYSRAAAGRVNTALNFFVFVSAFVTQWLFGELLDFFPAADGGATAIGYRVAFAILLVAQVASLLPLLLSPPPPRVED
ncbi:MFS transporter [Amorphus coralli]|uniref:MFS transporter n=1 Tax=Amorphus coralli TaxID=340680 RepID=UPI000371F024|nr:MFS transporter [Amorphus coralli]